MNLKQAKHLCRLSAAPSDGCTMFPDLGFTDDCKLHDHLLQHFVHFKDELNQNQRDYLFSQHLLGYILWADSKGRTGAPFTWEDANHLFRESLDEKVDTHSNPIKKAWYWTMRNVFYFGVTLWRRIK